jgi:hypothetical protein
MPMKLTDPRVTRDLADYHAIIAADIKDFTSNTDTGNWLLARRLPQILKEAFSRSGLDFSRVRFPGQIGDEYVAGLDYHKLPYLIHPLLDSLQDVLAELDAGDRGRGPRMRLRASIHIGPLPGEDDPDGPAGIGKAMNDLHRLLDCGPVRDALHNTDPDTTFVAAVISQRAYEDALLTGACTLRPSLLTEIPVHVKQFSSTAWLYVPQPSGQALHRAFTGDNPDPRATLSAAGHPEQIPGVAVSAAPAPIFHIGSAGQVAGTVTSPVTIRQTIHSSAELATKPNTYADPDTTDFSTRRPSSGESS